MVSSVLCATHTQCKYVKEFFVNILRNISKVIENWKEKEKANLFLGIETSMFYLAKSTLLRLFVHKICTDKKLFLQTSVEFKENS